MGMALHSPSAKLQGFFLSFLFLMDLFFEVIAIPIPFIFRIPSSFERPTALLSLCFFPTPSGATRQQLRLGDVSGVEPHPNYLAHTNSAVSRADSMPILIFRCRSDWILEILDDIRTSPLLAATHCASCLIWSCLLACAWVTTRRSHQQVSWGTNPPKGNPSNE